MVIKITPDGVPELGMVEVATTKFGGHPPEFWAKQLTEKIVGFSDDNEEHVKAQARAYQDFIKNALKSYKATLIQDLSSGGSEDLAKIIKGI